MSVRYSNKIRGAISEPQRHVASGQLHHRARRAPRGSACDLLEGKIATQLLARNAQLNSGPFHPQIRTRFDVELQGVAADAEMIVNGLVGIVYLDIQMSGQSNQRH